MLTGSSGISIQTKPLGEADYDTLIVGSAWRSRPPPRGSSGWSARPPRAPARVAAICLGAFILGDAGLLNGRRATTHWRYASILQERFPSCQVDLDKIFIEDGIWTSAGMTAGIDLVIGMIERDHGNDLAPARSRRAWCSITAAPEASRSIRRFSRSTPAKTACSGR